MWTKGNHPPAECFRPLTSPARRGPVVLLFVGFHTAIAAAMRRTNPKFVPREWMLHEAYAAAEAGNHQPLHELHELHEPHAKSSRRARAPEQHAHQPLHARDPNRSSVCGILHGHFFDAVVAIARADQR